MIHNILEEPVLTSLALSPLRMRTTQGRAGGRGQATGCRHLLSGQLEPKGLTLSSHSSSLFLSVFMLLVFLPQNQGSRLLPA